MGLFDWNVGLASQIVLWLTAGAMIVLWLSEVITDYGLGNGTSLLVYTNIVLLQNSTLNINLISSKRLSRVSSYDGREDDRISYLPLRFNQAGVMPIILTTSILVLPNYLINLGIFQSLNFLINFKWIYWPVYFALILAFSSFYSSIVLNPKDISDQLQKSAVKIPGVRPGVQTIYYLKQEIQRITLMGATLLAFITIVPNFLESTLNITSLNGLSTTSFLILGGVVLDLKREVSNIYFSEIYTDMYR